MSALDQILKYLDQPGASEVVIESGKPITVRFGGEARAVTTAPLAKSQIEMLAQQTALTILKGTGKPEQLGVNGKKYSVTLDNRVGLIRIAKVRAIRKSLKP